MEKKKGLKLKAAMEFERWDNAYKIIDFINKSVKDKNLVFGLSLSAKDKMIISIYEIE